MVYNMLLLVERLAKLIIAHICSAIGDLREICLCIKFVRFLNVQGLLYYDVKVMKSRTLDIVVRKVIGKNMVRDSQGKAIELIIKLP